jgi:hypothetical protein
MKLAISAEGIAIFRALDIAAARWRWKHWLRERDDNAVLVALHRQRLRMEKTFSIEERASSRVWLMIHGKRM